MEKLKVFFLLSIFTLCGDLNCDHLKTKSVIEDETLDEIPEMSACVFLDSLSILIQEVKSFTQNLSMKSGNVNLKLVEDIRMGISKIGLIEILENCAYCVEHVLRHLGAEFRRSSSLDFYPHLLNDKAFAVALFSVIFLISCIFKIFRCHKILRNDTVRVFESEKPFARRRARQQTEFQPGDLVYVEIAYRLKGKKTNAVKSGPYVIIKRVSGVTYEVDFINKCKNFINISKITPFVIRERENLNICN